MNWKWALSLLVGLAVAAHADDAEKGPPQPRTARLAKGILPPVAPDATADASADTTEKNGDSAARRVVVNLNANGQMTIGDAGRSLYELGSILCEQAKVWHDIRRKLGKSGRTKVGNGMEASTMEVLLRMDRNVPWIHAQWLMIICAEEKVYRLQFATLRVDDAEQRHVPRLDSYLKAWLPVDKGIPPRGAPQDKYYVKVHVVARKLEDAEFGPKESRTKVKRPTQIVYKVQDNPVLGNPVAGAADLRKAIRAELDRAKKAGLTAVGEIKAASKAPLEAVLLAMQAMRAEKLESIEFYGTAIPPRDVRRSRVLPYPKKN